MNILIPIVITAMDPQYGKPPNTCIFSISPITNDTGENPNSGTVAMLTLASSIELSNFENRCWYDISESSFTNPSGLLFFAFDCDATLYFYDLSVSPWKLVIGDALTASDYNRSRINNGHDMDGTYTPYVELVIPDALSVTERWVFRW